VKTRVALTKSSRYESEPPTKSNNSNNNVQQQLSRNARVSKVNVKVKGGGWSFGGFKADT
jgi:hypothetical protein